LNNPTRKALKAKGKPRADWHTGGIKNMGRRNTSNGSYQQKQSRHQQKEERKQTEQQQPMVPACLLGRIGGEAPRAEITSRTHQNRGQPPKKEEEKE
jgi:hypothetical protein